MRDIQLEAATISQLLSNLSLSYNIPIGIEIDPKDTENKLYRLEFKRGTVTELLTRFVGEYQQYEWEIRDGVVNIFPKEYRRDPGSELLATRISSFSVNSQTSCWNLVRSLISTPEMKRAFREKGLVHRDKPTSGFNIPHVGENFALTAFNTSLKEILNKIIRTSPSAKFWVFTADSRYQTISLEVNARFIESGR
ncbi:MAG TPA: hypothetical protein VJU84_00030 [Pyrinomonadaceae bacterium]|nr:hypothetical protein [Pyrinomonadaceae bacterium]